MKNKTELKLAVGGGPFQARPTGIVFPKNKVPFEKWESFGQQLRTVQGALQWAIGDWFNYGEMVFGDTAAQAWNIWPEYSYDMLLRFAKVARYIPFEERRPNISWSMHAEVHNLPKKDREEWLDKLAGGLTRADLRLALNGHKTPRPHCKTCNCYEENPRP
jgi:hypothetical protein